MRVNYICFSVRVNTRQGIKAEATDAGQREAWKISRTVSSMGRPRGLDSIPNHSLIHARVFVLCGGNTSTYTRIEHAQKNWNHAASRIQSHVRRQMSSSCLIRVVASHWHSVNSIPCPKSHGFWPCSELQVFSVGHPSLHPSYHSNMHRHTYSIHAHIHTYRADLITHSRISSC